ENSVGGKAKKPERRCLDDFLPGANFHTLADRHPVTAHQFLRGVICRQGDGEKDEAYHEQSPIVDAATNNLAHFLGNNPRHGVDRLKKGAEPLGKIGNRDPISRTQQHHHRLSDNATKTEQDSRYYSRKRRGNDHAPDGLKSICPERIGSLDKTTRHIAQRVLSEGKNRRHCHECEKGTRSEDVESLGNWEEADPMKEVRLG